MKIRMLLKLYGLIVIVIGVILGIACYGMSLEFGHPGNWPANLGLTEIRTTGQPTVTQYYISLFGFGIFSSCSLIHGFHLLLSTDYWIETLISLKKKINILKYFKSV